MLVFKFVRDFPNKELSPSVQNVEGRCFMMTFLFSFHFSQLVRQLKHRLVGVHVTVLLVLNAFLTKDASHALHIFIGAPVGLKDFILLLGKLILGTTNYSEVR